MKSKKTIGIILIILLCICIIAVFINKKKNAGETPGAAEQNTQTAEKNTGENESKTNTADTDSPEAATKNGEENTKEAEQNTLPDSGGDSKGSSDSGKTDTANKNTTSQEEENQKESGISFPYDIPNQDISITYLNSYDGLYIEDGSDQKIEGVTAILVKNNSEKAVEYGTITLDADDKELNFTFSALPSGKSCIVMEANQTLYDSKWTLKYESADFAFTDSLSKQKSKIGTEINENNGITITNKTGETIPRVRIFYKYRLESGEYVGGITYNCKLDDLEAGASQTIYPSHFSSEGSVVMMVRLYDSKED